MQRKQAHQVTKLKINACKGHDLQESNHKERITGRQTVKHGGNAKGNSNNQCNACTGQDGIKELCNGSFAHALKGRQHAEQEADRQEHGIDDKEYL